MTDEWCTMAILNTAHHKTRLLQVNNIIDSELLLAVAVLTTQLN